ncbi:RmlC-like cupin domain-containing protein [Apiospora kogelbergensis]|uniref:RmlC-like cupin domain-containing protein n=1 Tax=Apiospora kogelbergensis TaxID=1337665 RepID=UPI00312CF011
MGSNGKGEQMQSMLEALPSQHLEPLWPKMSAMVPPSPNPIAIPHMWKYADTLPHLRKAGEIVPAEDAERRVLMLVNPTMQSPHTTDTIYAGLQLVNPDETAPAHRHIAFAIRFIIEGSGFTAVEGTKMPLEQGDLVVTPTWHWHDHGNESNAPVIWLDVLNLPVFTFIRAHFAEGYGESRYPSEPRDATPWRFPWGPVAAALDSTNKPHAIHHYCGEDGQPLSKTLGGQAERIAPGHTTEPSRESCSFIYHCYRGRGKTTIEPPSGKTMVFHWASRDTFAVPAWSRIRHVNEDNAETAYLVAVSDRPLLVNLGLLRPEP